MEHKILSLKKEYTTKAKNLDLASKILKEEFVGIDNIIDNIIENVRSWYIMPDIQEKPAIVNLWGLTGTGKTSLVLRLMELLDFSNRTFRFDLGEKKGPRSFKDSLNDLCDNPDDSPIAIVLDELQHARTIKGLTREEIDNDENRMIWELIDSGRVTHVEWKRGLWELGATLKKLSELMNKGLVCEKGLVIKKKKLYLKEFEMTLKKGEKLYLIEEKFHSIIIHLAGNELGLTLNQDVKKLLMTMDGSQTLKLIERVLRIGTKPSEKNFTKAIIFVLGNIDEAYTMAGNYNADISADEFHEASLKITIPDIKNALRTRFRDEQIARLGNTHVIYPAFDSGSYRKIISLELEKINQRVTKLLGVELMFHDSIIDEIYKEGVYPTQGARPIFTTIHQIIKSKLSLYANVILDSNLEVTKMVFSAEHEELICQFFNKDELVDTFSSKISYNLEKLRKSKKNEEQAIAAVHESGHVILSMALMNVIPELVVSVTSDSGALGFMYAKNEKKFINRKEVTSRLAVLLGGMVAEELIFGKEYLTTGATSDIRKATELVMVLLKEDGFSKTPIKYTISNSTEQHGAHYSKGIEKEAKVIIETSKKLAKKTLQKNKLLLLEMSSVLAIEPKLQKPQIIEITKEFSDIDLTVKKEEFYYRNSIKEQLNSERVLLDSLEKNPIVLNKND